jgi:hypothetical protein
VVLRGELRRLRNARGLTQEQAAEAPDWSTSKISRGSDAAKGDYVKVRASAGHVISQSKNLMPPPRTARPRSGVRPMSANGDAGGEDGEQQDEGGPNGQETGAWAVVSAHAYFRWIGAALSPGVRRDCR